MRALLSISIILFVAIVAFFGGAAWKSSQAAHPSPDVALINQVNLMQLRRACMDQARKNFKENEQRKPGVVETFAAHYNVGLKKCFALYSTTTPDSSALQSTEFLYLEDAFEGVEYGNYDAVTSWRPGQNNQPKIMICERVPNGASQPPCKTRHEWNVFVEQYMENTQPDQ